MIGAIPHRMGDLPMTITSEARKDAADALRWVRSNCYRPRTVWDTCVVAATRVGYYTPAYFAIREVCIKFKPVANCIIAQRSV